ncbi:MAG TPA: F0F1 ATP synthase subunit B, partial [Candidatus Agrococcus pullicola]|nr:F0F1 ATP synthase subunit B [Candidatus Agrococcus pullicola]
EASRIIANAQSRIESERSSAAAELRREVGTLALDLSEKVVGESLTDDRASAIVDRFLADLEAQEAGR